MNQADQDAMVESAVDLWQKKFNRAVLWCFFILLAFAIMKILAEIIF